MINLTYCINTTGSNIRALLIVSVFFFTVGLGLINIHHQIHSIHVAYTYTITWYSCNQSPAQLLGRSRRSPWIFARRSRTRSRSRVQTYYFRDNWSNASWNSALLRHLPGTSLLCMPDPVHCPVEVLDVHPDVHPATFDGARDLRATIQGDLRDLPRSCAGLWLHEYHVIVYVYCVYCNPILCNCCWM